MAQTPADARIQSSTSLAYWKTLAPTVDSMLGGYPQVSRTDLRGSAAFFARLCRLHPYPAGSGLVGVDCGAGIGRVTAGFLSTVCSETDCVEPVATFAEQIQQQQLQGPGKIGQIFKVGLEQWMPVPNRYDLIWNQWCCLYLTDTQLIEYLQRCGEALKRPHGWIVVKENVVRGASDTPDIYDEEDSSVTRSDAKYLSIFARAGMIVHANELQKGFAQGLGLFPVRMYGLRPK